MQNYLCLISFYVQIIISKIYNLLITIICYCGRHTYSVTILKARLINKNNIRIIYNYKGKIISYNSFKS